jgi:hypothetical protein
MFMLLNKSAVAASVAAASLLLSLLALYLVLHTVAVTVENPRPSATSSSRLSSQARLKTILPLATEEGSYEVQAHNISLPVHVLLGEGRDPQAEGGQQSGRHATPPFSDWPSCWK